MPILNIYIDGSISGGMAQTLQHNTLQETNHSSIYIKGCCDDTAFWVFAGNLEKQVRDVVQNYIHPKISEFSLNEQKLRLNVYGYSRGGIGAFLVCQELKDIDPKYFEINVITVDPVSGNLKMTSYLDQFFNVHYTLSNRASDLSACKSLKNVTTLLANQSFLPAFAASLPKLPKKCKSVVDVIPGGHQGIEEFVKMPVMDFLRTHGTQFRTLEQRALLNKKRRKEYEKKVKSATTDVRSMHHGHTIYTRPHPKRVYFNKDHQKLAGVPINSKTRICTIKHSKPNLLLYILKSPYYIYINLKIAFKNIYNIFFATVDTHSCDKQSKTFTIDRIKRKLTKNNRRQVKVASFNKKTLEVKNQNHVYYISKSKKNDKVLYYSAPFSARNEMSDEVLRLACADAILLSKGNTVFDLSRTPKNIKKRVKIALKEAGAPLRKSKKR